MARRVRKQRHDEFILGLQRVVRCFADVFVAPRPTGDDVQVVANVPSPALLHGDPGLRFSMTHTFRVEDGPSGGPQVVTWGYIYSVLGTRNRDSGALPEIFAYHYHPLAGNAPAFPHLHVRSEPVAGVPVAGAHFRTGFVELTDIFRMLARDFAVRPRREHEDYEAVFADVDRRFAELRTYGLAS